MYKIVDVVKKENGRIDYYVIEDRVGNKYKKAKSAIVSMIESKKISNGTVYKQNGYATVYINKDKNIDNSKKNKENKENKNISNYYLGLIDLDGEYYKLDLISRKFTKSDENEIIELYKNKQTVGVEIKNNRLYLMDCYVLNSNCVVLVGGQITDTMSKYKSFGRDTGLYPVQNINILCNYIIDYSSPYSNCLLSLLYLDENKMGITIAPLYSWVNDNYYKDLKPLKSSDFYSECDGSGILFETEASVLDDDNISDLEYIFDDTYSENTKVYQVDCSIFANKKGEIVLRTSNPTVYGAYGRRHAPLVEKDTNDEYLSQKYFDALRKEPVWFTWGKYDNNIVFYKRKNNEEKVWADFLNSEKQVENKKIEALKRQKKLEMLQAKGDKEKESHGYMKQLNNEKFLIGYFEKEKKYYKIGLTSQIITSTTDDEIDKLLTENRAVGIDWALNGEKLRYKAGVFMLDFSDKYILYSPNRNLRKPSIFKGDTLLKDEDYLLYNIKTEQSERSTAVVPCHMYIILHYGDFVKSVMPLLYVDVVPLNYKYYKGAYGEKNWRFIGDWYHSRKNGVWEEYVRIKSYSNGKDKIITNFYLEIGDKYLSYGQSKSDYTVDLVIKNRIELSKLDKIMDESNGWFVRKKG